MKYYRLLLAILVITIANTACYKKHTCVCTVRDVATNEVVDTKDFSYRGNDSRPATQKDKDCASTSTQIDVQNNNTTTTTCVRD